MNMFDYSMTLAWWGIIEFGLETLPGSAAAGMVLSYPATWWLGKRGLTDGRRARPSGGDY